MKKHILFLTPLLFLFSNTNSNADAFRENFHTAEEVEEFLLAATLVWQKPYEVKGAIEETVPEATERRKEIAKQVWATVDQPNGINLFQGEGAERGKIKTALFVLANWAIESQYDVRVQKYHCKGMSSANCDEGKAWCLGQVHINEFPANKFMHDNKWKPEDLSQPSKCAALTLFVLHASMKMCEKSEGANKFSGYALGKCGDSGSMLQRYKMMNKFYDKNL